MHLNFTKFFINSIPFLLILLWRVHFGLLYIGFPSQFASRYSPGWKCETLSIPGGGMCEDIVDWKERGLAILTCDSNRRKWNTVMVHPLNTINSGTSYRSKSKRTTHITRLQTNSSKNHTHGINTPHGPRLPSSRRSPPSREIPLNPLRNKRPT